MTEQYSSKNEAHRTLYLCFDDGGVKSLYKNSTFDLRDGNCEPYAKGMLDSGIDLYFPKDVLCDPHKTTKISLGVKCCVYDISKQDFFEKCI